VKTDRSEVNVALNFNDGFIMPGMVSIYSFAKHNSGKGCRINMHILYSDISEKNRKRIEKLVGIFDDLTLNFIYVDDAMFSGFCLPKIRNIPYETYYKILLPRLLEEKTKVMYIDADTLTRCFVLDMYNDLNLEDVYIAGVQNAGVFRRSTQHLADIGLSEKDNYINAGQFIMNLELLRIDKKMEKMFDDAKNSHIHMEFVDQDLLMRALHKKTIYLSRQYNFTWADMQDFPNALEDVKMAHFNGSRKPWNIGTDLTLPFYQEWVDTRSEIEKLLFPTYRIKRIMRYGRFFSRFLVRIKQSISLRTRVKILLKKM